jgi:hypothetical protein
MFSACRVVRIILHVAICSRWPLRSSSGDVTLSCSLFVTRRSIDSTGNLTIISPLADYPFYIGQWLDVKDSMGSWYDSIGCRAVFVMSTLYGLSPPIPHSFAAHFSDQQSASLLLHYISHSVNSTAPQFFTPLNPTLARFHRPILALCRLEAQIIELDVAARSQIRVHYKGWKVFSFELLVIISIVAFYIPSNAQISFNLILPSCDRH